MDTFTSIEFCGEHVAATNNQFRQYYFDISDLVRDCCIEEQVLSINFGSAPRIADGIAQEPGQEGMYIHLIMLYMICPFQVFPNLLVQFFIVVEMHEIMSFETWLAEFTSSDLGTLKRGIFYWRQL